MKKSAFMLATIALGCLWIVLLFGGCVRLSDGTTLRVSGDEVSVVETPEGQKTITSSSTNERAAVVKFRTRAGQSAALANNAIANLDAAKVALLHNADIKFEEYGVEAKLSPEEVAAIRDFLSKIPNVP